MGSESKFVKDVMRPDLDRVLGKDEYKLIKQDPNTSFQGVPDYLLLYRDHWAALEAKSGPKAPRRPNQPYYIEQMGGMSYAAFTHPDNWPEVLDGLQEAFGVRG